MLYDGQCVVALWGQVTDTGAESEHLLVVAAVVSDLGHILSSVGLVTVLISYLMRNL